MYISAIWKRNRPQSLAAAAMTIALCCGCTAETSTTVSTETTDEVANEAPPYDGNAAATDEPAPTETASNSTPSTEQASSQAAGEPSNQVTLGADEALYAGIPGEGELTMEQIEKWLADERNHEPLDVQLPLGLAAGQGQMQGLEENPLTRAKIELGRQLFFDSRLSVDVSISCATCHDPETGFAAPTQFGVGVKGQTGNRNSPVAYNRIFSTAQFWDGRAASLEEQAKGPIANPIEMAHTHDACEECLRVVDGYRVQFERIFGELNIETVAKAIAAFERAIVTGPSPFDYYERIRVFDEQGLSPDDLKEENPELYAEYVQFKKAADEHPMSKSARRGRELFFSDRAGCTACHVGPNLSDEKYHNIGIGMDADEPDLGRYNVTQDDKDRGAFKTPTIRNIVHSAPYMHDGSQPTLLAVVEWYAKGGHANPHLSEKIKKLELSDQDKKDLVAFMEACTGEFPKIERERLPQ